MPHLILSDIHANLEALDAVLEDAAGRYDRILCLGDLVGYGADPNGAVEWTRANVPVVIRGNHDKDCSREHPLDHYSPLASASALWTRAVLTEESRDFLSAMARGPLRFEDFDLAHGSPADEDEYLLSTADALRMLPFVEAPLTFFGHTHIQGGYLLTPGGVKTIVPSRTLQLEPDYFYLINPGSVGQPRDGDHRAAYVLYSQEDRTVEYRRTRYDIRKAAKKIRRSGLPEALADRLFAGL